MTTGGDLTEYTVPASQSCPVGIAVGPDGNLWFTDTSAGTIGTVTTGGTITVYSPPTSASTPLGIITGPDDNVWFNETWASKIGMVVPWRHSSSLISLTSIPKDEETAADVDGETVSRRRQPRWHAVVNGVASVREMRRDPNQLDTEGCCTDG